jgi:hypothetical protein
MDDFIVYGNMFDEALLNLEKVLNLCKEINLSLNHDKCHMLLTKGIVLGHHISPTRIKVEPTKIKGLSNLHAPKFQKYVHIFLGHVGYYCLFIENFTKISSPMFSYFLKMHNFLGLTSVTLLLNP